MHLVTAEATLIEVEQPHLVAFSGFREHGDESPAPIAQLKPQHVAVAMGQDRVIATLVDFLNAQFQGQQYGERPIALCLERCNTPRQILDAICDAHAGSLWLSPAMKATQAQALAKVRKRAATAPETDTSHGNFMTSPCPMVMGGT